MTRTAFCSRLPAFHKLNPQARLNKIEDAVGLEEDERAILKGGGLGTDQADRMVENVIGTMGLPLAIAANFLIDGKDYLIPMAIEEPSVVAGASHAAKLVRQLGGFTTEATCPIMIGQIQVLDLPDPYGAVERLLEVRSSLLEEANKVDPIIVGLGGGAVDLQARVIETRSGPMLIVHLLYDVRDAMGANSINTTLERIAPLVQKALGGRVNLRILSNLATRRLSRATAKVSKEALAHEGLSGQEVGRRIVEAYIWAESDPYRACTHNKGIMNGIDAVALATGNDWRALEAGAHAYACREGHYRPLSWWEMGSDGYLEGGIELPTAVGKVGGATAANPTARVALKILGVNSASELGRVMAAVGLAQNLAALRALATEGIQRGHMALHARNLALTAGASAALADSVAERMIKQGDIRLARAQEILKELRKESS